MQQKPCLTCGATLIKRTTESWNTWNNHKFCQSCNSFKPGHTSYWKGKKRPEIQEWLKDVQFQKGHIPHNTGKPFLQIRGENHWKFKGDAVGYGALHNWVELRLGKASFCSNDKNHNAPIFHWANISGEYKRDLNDWHSLCPSCNKTDGISTKLQFDENRHRKEIV